MADQYTGRNPVKIGDRWGTLTVVSRRRATTGCALDCVCACGKRVSVASTKFRRQGYCPECQPVEARRTKDRLAYAPGARKGKLVILERHLSGTAKHPRFLVRCDCGAEYVCGGANLKPTSSCRQCWPQKYRGKYASKTEVKTPLYRVWAGMRFRCRNMEDPNYGGRGIRVCKEWDESFAVFQAWSLAKGYRFGLSIDRLNVDKGYEPDNCEWVTKAENSRRARATYVSVRRAHVGFARYLPIEALFGAV